GDDLPGGVGHVGGGDHVQPALGEHLAPQLDVGPLEADDEGDVEADLLGRGDDGGGDGVALHDAAEDVDEDGLDAVVAQEDAEGLGDLGLVGAAADVEEVGGVAAVV